MYKHSGGYTGKKILHFWYYYSYTPVKNQKESTQGSENRCAVSQPGKDLGMFEEQKECQCGWTTMTEGSSGTWWGEEESKNQKLSSEFILSVIGYHLRVKKQGKWYDIF